MRILGKYFLVLWIIIRNSFYKITTYRANFFSGLITDFCFNISRVVFVNVLFLNVGNLGNWNEYHYMIFFGSSFLAESIYMFFFYNSHTTISLQINNGDMDFLLTKPMSEMFMLSAMNVNIGSGLSNFILGVIFISKGMKELNLQKSVAEMCFYAVLIVCGSIVYFSVSLMINLLSFWFVRANNVFEIFMNVTDLYRYPGDIFSKKFSLFITLMIPLQLISMIPAKYLLDSVKVSVLVLEMVYPIIFLLLCYGFMRLAIASYTSASS